MSMQPVGLIASKAERKWVSAEGRVWPMHKPSAVPPRIIIIIIIVIIVYFYVFPWYHIMVL